MNPGEERYFARIEAELEDAINRAEAAKASHRDPSTEVEIPVAKDMADRVEKVLDIPGVADRVRTLENEMSREEAALELVHDFVEGTVGDFDTRAGKIEGAVRTAVALLTEGVVAAPIEGIDRVELLENDDGSEFINVYYAGPIRSAGGTAQALSVLVADYARSLLGISEYQARDIEVERYAEEVALYDEDTGLQYTPSDDETKHIARHMPIMLDGEATGDVEVSGFRDLERVDTNNPRGGMCLVLAEGIALKAPKIQRYTRELDEVEWPWLQDLIDGTVKQDSDGDEDEPGPEPGEEGGEARTDERDPHGGAPRAEASAKYLRDLIAGRPVFSHPSESGGFRLRYGRARNHGFATGGVNPATMRIVDDFLAPGTQLKTERPGKAHGVVPVDSIEGPTVRLANGDVRRIDDPEEALEVRNGVEEIIDLGEYLVNFGEFVENNQPLAPASYTVEWWEQDLATAGANLQALRDDPRVDLDDPTAKNALEWATEYETPLHPKYTYLWHDVSVRDLRALVEAIVEGEVTGHGDLLILENIEPVRRTLEELLVSHSATPDSLRIPDFRPLLRSLGIDDALQCSWTVEDLSVTAREYDGGTNAIRAVNEVAPFEVRERAPTRVGCRMGRPEKSEKRELSPAVHTLFPIGEAGGNQRDVGKAARTRTEHGKGILELEVGERACEDCDRRAYETRCPECGGHTEPYYECNDCEIGAQPDEAGRVECPRCGDHISSPSRHQIDVGTAYQDALDAVGEREAAFEILKGVKGLSSAHKTPEPLEKGVLRAKHDVSVFKDGTIRYDMTDLPVTAVRPAELDVSADHFRELGYETDVEGEPLRHDDQLVELKIQDVILSEGAAEHMTRTADFVDELLTDVYGLDPFYELTGRDDLVGELVFGMAPHTSAAVVGRVVGFTSASVGYAHPYFHAAKRRNCFHPETKLWYRDGTDEWHHQSVERFVEERLDSRSASQDDFGALVTELEEDVYVPSVTTEGAERLKPVEAVSKHPSPHHLIRIETQEGRSVTVTPEHSMRRWDDGIERVDARDLAVGDTLPVPADVEFDQEQHQARLAADGAGTGSRSRGRPQTGASLPVDKVITVDPVRSGTKHTYSLTVGGTNTLVANDLYVGQCDGDEDCVMLLMDGLINFSKQYLPDSRGGRMDAPLVMSSRIDPAEIDDEAHNIDVVDRYPRELYEASRRLADPEEVRIELAEDTLGTPDAYHGFAHTHDTSDIAAGPNLSAYKTLGSMMDKMDAQLELARTLRAVDETDVAERVIEYHFLPDLIGNLRAFSRQETRCLDCGEKYRRMPLSGDCRECGGDVTLTVHEGSVNKYLGTALRVAEEYGCREYTKQRLEILDRSIESVFQNDKNKQSGIADFM